MGASFKFWVLVFSCALVVGCVPGQLNYYSPTGPHGYLGRISNPCYGNAPKDVFVSQLTPELEVVVVASVGRSGASSYPEKPARVSLWLRSPELVELESGSMSIDVGGETYQLVPDEIFENGDATQRKLAEEGGPFVSTTFQGKFVQRVIGYRGNRKGGAVMMVNYSLPEGVLPDQFIIDLPKIRTRTTIAENVQIEFRLDSIPVTYSLNC